MIESKCGRRTIVRTLSGIVLLLVTGCGESDNAGGLIVTSLPGEARFAASLVSQNRRSLALEADNTEIAMVWPAASIGGGTEIVAQVLDRDLEELGDRVNISGPSERSLVQPAACRNSDAWVAAWSDIVPAELLPSGVTLDRTNVWASSSWSSGVSPATTDRVHPNVIGEQLDPEIACSSDGHRVVTWSNSCVAVQRIGQGFFHFKPAECETEPADGAWLQVFDENGNAIGEMSAISSGVGRRAPVAAIDSGRFVVLAGSTIQVRSSNGELEEERMVEDVDFSAASLSCAGRRCAAAVGGDLERVWLIDTAELDSIATVTLATTSEPEPNHQLIPVDADLACAPTGTCLATWLLRREITDDDVIFTESEGVYARAFDVRTGRLGPEARILDPMDTEEGVVVASQGDGLFATARISGDDIVVGQVEVR
jgi:hypothetical protein